MNIALIGMMGAGKSTVGKELQKFLIDYSFVDTDEEIVKFEGKSVNDIFAQNGETYFRQKETQILRNILNSDNLIISTGGGIIKSDENIKALRQKSFVIYLETNSNNLFERVKANNERPLLKEGNVKNKIETLLSEREQKYKETAHKTVDTNNKTTGEITQEIYQWILSLHR